MSQEPFVIGSILNHDIIVERVKPKVSKKFSTSVNQYNIHLKKNMSYESIQLNSENIDALREILNQFYLYVNKRFDYEKHKNIFFQMNITLKGKVNYVSLKNTSSN